MVTMMNSLKLLIAISLSLGCGTEAAKGNQDSGPFDDADAALEIDEQSRVSRYIRSDVSSQLILEIDSVPGFEPRAAAEGNVLGQLDQLLDKPGGISAVHDGALVSKGEDHAWTDEELFQLADETFDLAVDESTIKMHILFVDGHSARNTGSGVILGLAWANTHLVMFKQSIEEICAGPLTPPLLRDALCESAEFSIWLHEVGHVIGLVNTGLSMAKDHQDVEHGGHDVSDQCVMYWAYEGDAVVNQLRDRIIGGNNDLLAFDEECLADVAAVRLAP